MRPFGVPVQLALVTLLVASYIWFGRHAFPGSQAAFAVLLALLLLSSHRQRGDSARGIGFRLDTAPRTALWFAPVAVVALAITLAAGSWKNSLAFPAFPGWLLMLGKLLLFGIAQQYALLGFYHRGIEKLVPSPAAAMLLTALVFAAFHVPNPFLVVVTFFAALVAVAIYRRSPNLWVTGLTHGLISFFLFYSLPFSLTGGLRVGPEY
jgi:membrane protease YdiL (CAAX protease family)